MTITIAKIDKVVNEIHRFLFVAGKAKNRLKENKYASVCGCKETGAVRRASMDLTRALVEIRKPN